MIKTRWWHLRCENLTFTSGSRLRAHQLLQETPMGIHLDPRRCHPSEYLGLHHQRHSLRLTEHYPVPCLPQRVDDDLAPSPSDLAALERDQVVDLGQSIAGGATSVKPHARTTWGLTNALWLGENY